MGWIIYGTVLLAISILIGLHLGRFREAYTEMTGMMAGMTMGMANGFVLGYAAAAATNSLFWGNIIGMALGVVVGGYYGRAGSLMGIMDGSMGGAMGGSMGAMLLIMLVWPPDMIWTAAFLTVLYVLSMFGLVVLIERSAPEHAAFHRLLPYFARAMRLEAAEQFETGATGALRRAPIDDYYTFLGIERDAAGQQITDAYLEQLSMADEYTLARAERAYAILTDPVRRRAYDARLDASIANGDCCPPPRRKRPAVESAPARNTPAQALVTAAAVANAAPSQAAGAVTTRVATRAKAAQPAAQPAKSGGKRSGAAQTKAAGARQGQQTRQRARAQQQRTSPISWVGGAAALTIAGLLLVWWIAGLGSPQASANPASGSSSLGNVTTANGAQLPADFVQKLDAQAVSAPVAADGSQKLDLVIDGAKWTYIPKVIKVKQGSPVTFNLSIQGPNPGCGRFVGIDGLGVHGIANLGQTTQMSFTPSKSGVFQINCNMHMMDPGYLIVQ